jgi:hypothetical protein
VKHQAHKPTELNIQYSNQQEENEFKYNKADKAEKNAYNNNLRNNQA